MVCVGNFFCLLWTRSAGSAVLCAGSQGDKEASLPNLLCLCFGDGALRPSKANVSRVHLQLWRHQKLGTQHQAHKTHLKPVVSLSNVVKFTYCRACRLNFFYTYASFLLTSRLPTEEETFKHQCYVFSLLDFLWELLMHVRTDIPVLSNCFEPPAAKQPG